MAANTHLLQRNPKERVGFVGCGVLFVVLAVFVVVVGRLLVGGGLVAGVQGGGVGPGGLFGQLGQLLFDAEDLGLDVAGGDEAVGPAGIGSRG